VVLDAAGGFRFARTAKHIAELADVLLADTGATGETLELLAIDIPIGLPYSGLRPADLAARAALGPRRSSLFVTPIRRAVEEVDYACANRLSREITGLGMSKQAHALRQKILDVDHWLAGRPALRAIEVHPELSFARMAGAPMPYAKKTWAGMQARRAALAAAGIDIPTDLGPAGMAAPDDILDAAAAAWTAVRHLGGAAVGYPDAPRGAAFARSGEARIWA
jgi:predicted RNase H-like nuclease